MARFFDLRERAKAEYLLRRRVVIDPTNAVPAADVSDMTHNANPGWNASGSVTADTITAPDHTLTADSVTGSGVGQDLNIAPAGGTNARTFRAAVYSRSATGTGQYNLKCTHGGVADFFKGGATYPPHFALDEFTQAFAADPGTGRVIGGYTALSTETVYFWNWHYWDVTGFSQGYVDLVEAIDAWTGNYQSALPATNRYRNCPPIWGT